MPQRLSLAASIALTLSLGCASGDSGPRPPGGTDGGRADGAVDAGGTCTVDSDCTDDGMHCNGGVVCRMGTCMSTPAPNCNDGVGCTRDECIEATRACQNTPDDAACPMGTSCIAGSGCQVTPACEFDADCAPGDGVFCNGDEVCLMGMCESPGTRTCDDTNNCTMDACIESARGCGFTAFADMLANPEHCGVGMNDCDPCPMPAAGAMHVHASCTIGVCGYECDAGWYDTDMNPMNGCETDCLPDPMGDRPDDAFTDSNCDMIDGDRMRAVFVSTRGADTNDGLTSTTPVATFARALTVAAASSRDQILVALGDYGTSMTLTMPDGVGIYGGYSDDFLVRNNMRPRLSTSTPTAILARNLTRDSVIDRIDLATENQTAASAATTTLVVINSVGHLSVRWLAITAGRGGDGSAGGSGSTGTGGSSGSPGSGATGGGGGSVGGGGGRTGVNRAAGSAGTAGAPGSCGVGGAAGPGSGGGGLGCGDGDPAGGGSGGTGCTGTTGAHGAGGTAFGSVGAMSWSPSNGADGTTGGTGGGGGGGGAGGGENCTDPIFGTCIYCDTGRGGGGGGGGGRGGTGGGGGGGGGASIGILVIDSTVNLENVGITTAGGGGGGPGGGGGGAGTPGPGAAGGTASNSSQGPGGRGGDGGPGGAGGCGGGGGGGPSVGVYGNGGLAQIRVVGMVTYSVGAGGSGGSSCSGGNAGATGTSTQRRNVTML